MSSQRDPLELMLFSVAIEVATCREECFYSPCRPPSNILSVYPLLTGEKHNESKCLTQEDTRPIKEEKARPPSEFETFCTPLPEYQHKLLFIIISLASMSLSQCYYAYQNFTLLFTAVNPGCASKL